MLTEQQLGERLRAGLDHELSAINPPEDLLERLRRQATRADAARHARSPLVNRPSAGGVLAALGGVVAVGVAIAAVVLLGHARSPVTPGGSAARPSVELLDGGGLGSVKFGDAPPTVVAALTPLLGNPLGRTRATPSGLVHSICGFDGQIEWRRPIGNSQGHSIFDDLVAYFKNSRFVGYSYSEGWTPYGPRPALPSHHRALLTTPRGLTLDQPATRGRQVYGTAFVQVSQPQGVPPSAKLPRLPAWRVRSANGELFGALTSRPRLAIATINAGAVPNTPCR